jgi:hypothetical protein
MMAAIMQGWETAREDEDTVTFNMKPETIPINLYGKFLLNIKNFP